MPIHSKPETWGGNSMSKQCLSYFIRYLPIGKTILELGSGWASGELAKRWNVWSIENNPVWFKKYHDQAFLVPLKNGWYDREILKESISGLKYNMLLIDGPYDNREGLLDNLDLFDTSVKMIFDDVRRERGRAVLEAVSQEVGRSFSIRGSDRSMFGVI